MATELAPRGNVVPYILCNSEQILTCTQQIDFERAEFQTESNTGPIRYFSVWCSSHRSEHDSKPGQQRRGKSTEATQCLFSSPVAIPAQGEQHAV